MCVEGGEKMETLDLCEAPNEKSSDLAASHVSFDLLPALLFTNSILFFSFLMIWCSLCDLDSWVVKHAGVLTEMSLLLGFISAFFMG